MMLDLPLPFGPIIHEKRCTDKGQSDLQRERNPAQPHHPFKAQLLLLRAEGLRAELLLPKVKSESKPHTSAQLSQLHKQSFMLSHVSLLWALKNILLLQTQP